MQFENASVEKFLAPQRKSRLNAPLLILFTSPVLIAGDESEALPAAFTRLSRRVVRPAVLRLGSGRQESDSAVQRA